MLNFLALLGWSPGNDIEVMTVAQMIELFSAEGLSKKAAVFDTKKLEWMNGQHLSAMPTAELAPLATRAIAAAGLATESGSRVARGVVLLAARPAQGARAHDRRHRAPGGSVLCATTIEYEPDAVAKQWKDRDGVARRAARNAWRVGGRAAVGAGATRGGAASACRVARHWCGQAVSAAARRARRASRRVPGSSMCSMLLGRERSLERIDAAVRQLASRAAVAG